MSCNVQKSYLYCIVVGVAIYSVTIGVNRQKIARGKNACGVLYQLIRVTFLLCGLCTVHTMHNYTTEAAQKRNATGQT